MIDKGNIGAIIAQMKAMRTDANPGIQPIQAPRIDKLDSSMGVSKSSTTGFGDLLKNAIDSVNREKMQAKSLSNSYQMGDPTVDLPQVMIQAQKSTIAFEALTQVRNRLVRAYEEIMSMGI
jgi:flagellar hook-basal body complex protein FliE